MRQRLAPSHDICARMRYVPIDDTAWRWDLINSETEAMKERGEDPYDHAYWVYFTGRTRFDLDDPAITPYLADDVTPETWRFRRLPLDVRQHCEYLIGQGRHGAAHEHAFLEGVTGLDGAVTPEGQALAALLSASKPGERSEKQKKAIKQAAEDYAASVLDEVGKACFRGSQDLTAAEKKS